MALGHEAEDRVIGAMKQLGFTATDAKTYIALLRFHPSTGYELAAKSRVPRSAIYGVLKRLESLGLVNVVEEKPTRYVPLPPERLIELLDSRFSRNVETFMDALHQVVGDQAEVATWTVVGYSALLEQAQRLIDGAERRIVTSIWRREALRLQSAFERAVERGIDVVLFSFTPLPSGIGEVLSYGVDEAELLRHWSPRLILLADESRLIVGSADDTQANRSVVTEEKAIVEIATANLVLDVTLFGQRRELDTAAIVGRLTSHIAPVDDLIENARPRT